MLLLLLLTILILVLSLTYIIYKPPPFLITYIQRRYPEVIFHVPLPAGQKVVALTIDDAPSPYTPAILDILKKHNATATFFIIGSQLSSVPNGKAIVQRIHKEGHDVGNHAFHDEPSISLPLAVLRSQILELDRELPENKSKGKWFRPGSGFFNHEILRLVNELGYRLVLGNVYPHDAQITRPGWNARHVLSGVRKGGDVVIMHDRRGYSVEQIELVLRGLGERGWRVVSLGELMRIQEESKEDKGRKAG
jgi:peptidoglycan/xylan/chitin deacetylase (PgdA/CDA1 family)